MIVIREREVITKQRSLSEKEQIIKERRKSIILPEEPQLFWRSIRQKKLNPKYVDAVQEI